MIQYKMAKKNTVVVRSDPEFKKLLDNVLMKKPRSIKTSRVTLAMARQYKKYPQIMKELMDSDLK